MTENRLQRTRWIRTEISIYPLIHREKFFAISKQRAGVMLSPKRRSILKAIGGASLASISLSGLGTAQSASLPDRSWPMARHDLRNTNRNATIYGPQGPPDEVWSQAIGAIDPVRSNPGFITGPVGNGRSEVYSGGEALRAFDADSGEQLWATSDVAAQFTTPALGDEVVYSIGYAPTTTEKQTITIYAVDPDTGDPTAQIPVTEIPARTRVRVTAPKVTEQRLFFYVTSDPASGSTTSRIYSVNLKSEEVCWCQEAALTGSTLAIDQERELLIPASQLPTAYRLSDGTRVWRSSEDLPTPEVEPLIGEYAAFFAAEDRIYGLSLEDGSLLWNTKMPELSEAAERYTWTPFAIRTDLTTLYIGSQVSNVFFYEDSSQLPSVSRASLYALDTETGEVKSTRTLPAPLQAPVPAVRTAPGLPAFGSHLSGWSAPVLSNDSLYIKSTDVSEASGGFEDETTVQEGIARYNIDESGELTDPFWTKQITQQTGRLSDNLTLLDGTLYLHAANGSESSVIAYQDLE